MSLYSQIAVTSLNKAVNIARSTGKMNLQVIGIYNLYRYYIDFTEGKADYEEENKCLKQAIDKLKYKYPDILCLYKWYIPTVGYQPPADNVLPTVSGATVPLLEEESIFFTEADFTTNYADPENRAPGSVLIYTTGVPGTFKYNGTVVTGTIELEISDVTSLEYTRVDPDAAFAESLPFRISDSDPFNPLYSTVATNSLTGTIAGNQPATIGDNTIYAANRAVTVLTLAMFTTDLTPPYNDPDADLIDAIRLDDISEANLGEFQLNGTPVVNGQIITREDINGGLFTHVAPNQDALSSDNFSFSARDEGSLEWVT